MEWEVGPCKWSRPRKQQRSPPIWSSGPKGNRWVNCILFVLVDLSRTMIAGVGLGLRTVRGTSFCLIQLGPKTGGSWGEMGGPNRCRSLCSARAPDHLCTPIIYRPKWNGSLSYAVPRPEFPRLLLSARNPSNTTWRSSTSFYAATGFPGLAFWEARSHRAPGPAGLPAVVEIPPFPGKKKGWLDAGSTPRGAVRT